MKILNEPKKETKEKFVFAIIILAVLGFGFLAVNQTLQFFYRAHFLKAPCDLCKELNPNVSSCIEKRINIYPDGFGGWAEEVGRINNLSNLSP